MNNAGSPWSTNPSGRRHRHRRRNKKWDYLDCAGAGCDGCDGCDLSLLLPTLITVLAGAFRASAVDPFSSPAGLGAAVASRLVRSYQVNVSARRARPVCNLTPSCSRYGLQVIGDHGVLRGIWLIRGRIAECSRVGAERRSSGAS